MCRYHQPDEVETCRSTALSAVRQLWVTQQPLTWRRPTDRSDRPAVTTTLEPVPRPQPPIKTENVLTRLLVTAPDQPIELTEPAIL